MPVTTPTTTPDPDQYKPRKDLAALLHDERTANRNLHKHIAGLETNLRIADARAKAYQDLLARIMDEAAVRTARAAQALPGGE